MRIFTHNKLSDRQHQAGAIVLIMAVVLMTLTTLIIIFAANYSILLNKSISNITRANQAFEAAEAGLEFGIVYLQKYSSTILANPVSGFIPSYSDSNITNVTLPNNSKFSITYSNPTAYNYNLIKVSATGTNDDGSSTHTVSQLIEFGSLLLNIPTRAINTIGTMTIGGSSTVTNNYNDFTVRSGSTVSITSSGSTTIDSGTSSTSGNIRSDITQNDTALAATSADDLFSNYFGLSPSIVQGTVAQRLTNNTNTDYSSTLSGKKGTSIQIDQTSGTASLSGSTIIGSSTNPVILIINGNASISQTVIIYGFLFLNNPSQVTLRDNVMVIGGIVSTGALRLTDSAHVWYSGNVLDNLQSQSSMRYYTKIPGSWKDF